MSGDCDDDDNRKKVPRLKSPPIYDNDRRAIYAAVARDAERAWRMEKDRNIWWKLDVNVWVHALTHSPTLPTTEEPTFDDDTELRQILLARAQRSDFLTRYRSYGPPPARFRGDKQLMMAYLKHVPRWLQDCDESLTEDFDVVHTAVSVNGMALQYASRDLQQHPDLLMAACQNDGNALSIAPLRKWNGDDHELLPHEKLWHDRDFFANVVIPNGGGNLMRDAPEMLQKDPQLVAAALGQGLRLRYIHPEILERHPDVISNGIRHKAELYAELPQNRMSTLSSPVFPCQSDLDVALAACMATNATPELQLRALRQCPQLRQNRQAILAYCQTGGISADSVKDVVSSEANMIDDHEIVLAAVTKHPTLFPLLPSMRLQRDPDIILAGIHDATAASTLSNTPVAVLSTNPGIVVKCIRVCKSANLRSIQLQMPAGIWNADKSIIKAWLERGGQVLDVFEGTVRNDEDLALTLVEWNLPEAANRLTTQWHDREFLLKAAAKNGQILAYLPDEEHRNDFELVVTAVAQTPQAIIVMEPPAATNETNQNRRLTDAAAAAAAPAAAAALRPVVQRGRGRTMRYQRRMQRLQQQNQMEQQNQLQPHPPHLPNNNNNNNREVVAADAADANLWIPSNLIRRIDELLNLHEVFVRDVLRGVMSSSGSTLFALNCGVETSQALLQHIAGYIGVPVGQELAKLNKARRNVDAAVEIMTNNQSTTTSTSRMSTATNRFQGLQLILRDRMRDNDDDDDEDDDDDDGLLLEYLEAVYQDQGRQDNNILNAGPPPPPLPPRQQQLPNDRHLGRPAMMPPPPPPPLQPLRRPPLPPLVPIPSVPTVDDYEQEHLRFLEYFRER